MSASNRPQTPDGRYLVARGVLKRCTNPALDDKTRRRAIKMLMQARMTKDSEAVLVAKTELGEAGPVWWDDGEPDHSGQAPMATSYADWWNALSSEERDAGNLESRPPRKPS